MPLIFLPGDFFSLCRQHLVHLDQSCKLHIWVSHVCLLRERWDTQVFVGGSVKLIYDTTDDAMNYFMGPHLSLPNFFWLLQLEHFSTAMWDINAIFLWDWYPTRILWLLWASLSPSISNVQLLLTNSSLIPVMLGSTKTLSFCNKARNHVKKIQRVKVVCPLIF